jgi:uncharacterized membrane protein YdfJ with MMPL/SSD domain
VAASILGTRPAYLRVAFADIESVSHRRYVDKAAVTATGEGVQKMTVRRIGVTGGYAMLAVVAWLVLTAVLPALAPRLSDVEDNRSVNDPPATAESMRATRLLRAAFPDQRGTPALVVVARPGGRLDAADMARVTAIAAALSGPRRPAGTADAVAPGDPRGAGLVSADDSTATIVVPVLVDPSDPAFPKAVDAVRATVRGTVQAPGAAPGLRVAVTGPAGIITDTVKVFSSANLTLLFGALALVLLILLKVYRAPLLAIIPLLAAGIAVQITQALGALLVKAGIITVNSQTASIMSVLVIGLGTDYCLFIISGYRDRLREIPRPDLATRLAAMRAAVTAVTDSLLYSAATVVLALLTLLLATLPALRSFGPFLALSVVVTLLVCATFVPAAVVLAGRAALWPRLSTPDRGPRRAGGWAAIAATVVRRPGMVIAVSLALFAVLSLGLLGYRQSYDFIAGFRVDTESKTGQQLLATAFPAGQLAPTQVVIDNPATLPELRTAVTALPGVREVSTQTAPDGRLSRLTIVYTDNPYHSVALDRTQHIRDLAHRVLARAGGHAWTGGQSAVSLDLRTANDRDLRLLVPATLLVIALVLAAMTRSLLAPLYLVATIVASLAATLGATTLLLITLSGSDGYGVRVVAYIFVFLTALGVDYNIYLVTQLRRAITTHGLTAGLITTLIRGSRVITSAGTVLAASFAILLSQPIDGLFQFGFAMAAGILLDTFLVRGLLVPAIITKLGSNAWWPSG